jgi:VWFA-related protein
MAAMAVLMVAWRPTVGSAQVVPQTPVFRAAVDRVTVAATVRDRRGRPVTNLVAKDFQVLDRGVPQTILSFQREMAPMHIAVLADFSGSMDIAYKRAAARNVANQLIGYLKPGEDHVGLFAFDYVLEEVQPLRPAPGDVIRRMDSLEPWGRTRLFDAIAETGERVARSGAARRAVVVLTDGDDNASQLTPAEVSGVASSIDVPVYVIIIVSPLDRVGRSGTVIASTLTAHKTGALGDLARWTGGEILVPVSPEDVAQQTQQLVTELRHQYLIAFEPSRLPGWHPLELRTRKTDLVVRARSGYVVPGRPTQQP